MLSEYVTHVVRSIVACDIMSPRNLSEIMQIDEDCFNRMFGQPRVSDELQLRHLEALTRFFGCRMYDTGFLLTVGRTSSTRHPSYGRSRDTQESPLERLSKTADRMLLGGNEDYGRSSACARLLARQVIGVVEWNASMAYILSTGVRSLWEVGPGRVLRGLMKRIDRGVACHGVFD